MKTFLLLFLSLACLSGVQSQDQLVQSSDPVVIKPGTSHKLSCKGSRFTFSSYGMNWVRQSPGGGLQWVGYISSGGGSTTYDGSVKGRFTISRDNTNNMLYLQMDNVKTEDTAVYYCARLSGFDIWSAGQMVTVRDATQQAPSLFPLIPCGTSQDSTVTVGCLAKDFLPETIDFSWNDKSNSSFTNGLLKYKPVLQSTGTYVASSQIKVTAASWNQLDPYYCMAKHLQNTQAVKLVNEVPQPPSPPVVTMHAPVKDDLYVYGNGTIVCVMKDFSPGEIKVKWFKNHVETTDNTVTGCVSKDANGKYALSSYITVSKKEWDEDTEYSCNVIHAGISETRNLSKSQTCEAPAVSGVIQVAVEPPTFDAIFITKKAPLTCIISNMQTIDGLEVTWHELGSEIKLPIVLDNPVFQGSLYSIKATTTVCADDWYNKKYECRVKHPDLTSPKKVILAKDKSQTPHPPTVYLFGPHQDELNNKESLTLTCCAKGMFPADSFIRWTRNGQVEDRYVVTTKPMEEPYASVNKSYVIYSSLTLPSIEDWSNGSVYGCIVGHEALPLQTTQRSIDKNTGKPTSVNVSLVMSDSC